MQRHPQLQAPAMGGRLPQGKRGFTLVEMMIVVAVMAVAMAIGIPTMFRVADNDTTRKVHNDILDACIATRAKAILEGSTQTLVVNPQGMTIQAPGKGTVKIPNRFRFEVVYVNYVDIQDFDHAPVRFFANGTCDKLYFILVTDKNERKMFATDMITGLPDVETDPLRFEEYK